MDVWYYSHHTVVRANVLAPAIFSKSLDLFSPFFGHKMDFPFRKCRYTFVCIFASTHLRAGSWHRWLGSVHPFGEQQQIRKKKKVKILIVILWPLISLFFHRYPFPLQQRTILNCRKWNDESHSMLLRKKYRHTVRRLREASSFSTYQLKLVNTHLYTYLLLDYILSVINTYKWIRMKTLLLAVRIYI